MSVVISHYFKAKQDYRSQTLFVLHNKESLSKKFGAHKTFYGPSNTSQPMEPINDNVSF